MGISWEGEVVLFEVETLSVLHSGTSRLLLRDRDPARPSPTFMKRVDSGAIPLSYFSNSSRCGWVALRPMGEMLTIPLRYSMNVPLEE